jgi:hypothetical protein
MPVVLFFMSIILSPDLIQKLMEESKIAFENEQLARENGPQHNHSVSLNRVSHHTSHSPSQDTLSTSSLQARPHAHPVPTTLLAPPPTRILPPLGRANDIMHAEEKRALEESKREYEQQQQEEKDFEDAIALSLKDSQDGLRFNKLNVHIWMKEEGMHMTKDRGIVPYYFKSNGVPFCFPLLLLRMICIHRKRIFAISESRRCGS